MVDFDNVHNVFFSERTAIADLVYSSHFCR